MYRRIGLIGSVLTAVACATASRSGTGRSGETPQEPENDSHTGDLRDRFQKLVGSNPLKMKLFVMGAVMAENDLGRQLDPVSINDLKREDLMDLGLWMRGPVYFFRSGVHETIHARNREARLAADPEFQNFFQKLLREKGFFLDYIECKNHHHTASNCTAREEPSEFLAALVTSTYSRHFVKRMKTELPRYRVPYVESLKELQDLIRRKVSPEAPLAKRISVILGYLEASD